MKRNRARANRRAQAQGGNRGAEWRPDKSGPRHLYHYTSLNAFLQILRNRELWATHVFFLNDTGEFKKGTGALETAIQRRLRTATSTLRKRLLALRRAIVDPEATAYVASFSDLDDDLGQWRAYARPSGVAIGFPRRQLQAWGVDRGFLTVPCEYRDRAQVSWMHDVLDDAMTGRWIGPDAGIPRGWNSVDEALWLLPHHASTMKDDTFKAESEWRAIVVPSCLANHKLEERFRVREGALVPYVGLPLPDRSERRFWSSVRITLSPELSNPLQETAVCRAFQDAFGVDCHVAPSSVSLRRRTA